MTTKYCEIAIIEHFQIPASLRFCDSDATLGTDPVHSAHVTATPLLSLIQPFLLRPCVLPLRFCDPRWLHYIKKERGKKKLSRVCAGSEYKAAPFSRNSLYKLESMDTDAATKEGKQATHDALSRLRLQGRCWGCLSGSGRFVRSN
jgi:hypothetical protein